MSNAKSLREQMFAEIRRVREESQGKRKFMAQSNPTIQVSGEEDYVSQNCCYTFLGTLKFTMQETE